MIASRVVVVAEVVAELAFRMNLPGIYNVNVSAFFYQLSPTISQMLMEV